MAQSNTMGHGTALVWKQQTCSGGVNSISVIVTLWRIYCNKPVNETTHDLDFLCSAIAFPAWEILLSPRFKVQLLCLFINTPNNILSFAWLFRNRVELQNNITSPDKRLVSLIICCTTFGGNHCNQTFSVTLTETLAVVSGYLAYSSWSNCSCHRGEGCLLQIAYFSSFHRCLIAFWLGLIEGHFFQNIPVICS